VSDSQRREQVIRREISDFLVASGRLDPMIYPALRDIFQYTWQQRPSVRGGEVKRNLLRLPSGARRSAWRVGLCDTAWV